MLPPLLKQSRFGKSAALALLLAVGGILFYGLARMNGPEEAPARREGSAYDTGTNPTRQMKGFVDHFGNLVERQGKELSTQAGQIEHLNRENAELKKAAEELHVELTRLNATLAERQAKPESIVEDMKRQLMGETTNDQSRIRKIAIPQAKEDAKLHTRFVRLPAGSFAEATLLTGVYAPTEGQAMPVKLRLDAAFVCPNRARIPIQEAFLIGKAIGEPNSERVIVQLDRLSYVKPSGGTVEVSVNGYVVDNDGIQGVAGQYVWRAFDVASLGILSGALSAGTDAMAAKETLAQTNPLGGTSQIVTGDPLRFVTYRGLSRAGEGIEKLVVKRLEEIVPAVYVANGKQVTVCLIDGVTLENVSLDEVTRETSTNPFAGLDFDR